MDLAEVNGQVFVDNVSLGVDAEAVQREGDCVTKPRIDCRDDAVSARPLGVETVLHPRLQRALTGTSEAKNAVRDVSNRHPYWLGRA